MCVFGFQIHVSHLIFSLCHAHIDMSKAELNFPRAKYRVMKG
jgi:hypothetical protein